MKMPDGWERLDGLLNAIEWNIPDARTALDLMKEMAEALEELVEEHRDEFMNIRYSLQNADKVLNKFKEWR